MYASTSPEEDASNRQVLGMYEISADASRANDIAINHNRQQNTQ